MGFQTQPTQGTRQPSQQGQPSLPQQGTRFDPQDLEQMSRLFSGLIRAQQLRAQRGLEPFMTPQAANTRARAEIDNLQSVQGAEQRAREAVASGPTQAQQLKELLLSLGGLFGGEGPPPEPGSRENPVQMSPVEVSMNRASEMSQDPFVRDTLASLVRRFEGFETQPGTPFAGSVSRATPFSIQVPEQPVGDPRRRQDLAAHEFGHVVDFTDIAPPDLVFEVAKRFPEATDASSTRGPREHFATAFEEAWNFIRGTGTYKPGRFEEDFTPEDADFFVPGTSNIIEWLREKGFEREAGDQGEERSQ